MHLSFWQQLHVLLLLVAAVLFVFVHAAVTDLDGILVEDFSEIVIFRKVLVY